MYQHLSHRTHHSPTHASAKAQRSTVVLNSTGECFHHAYKQLLSAHRQYFPLGPGYSRGSVSLRLSTEHWGFTWVPVACRSGPICWWLPEFTPQAPSNFLASTEEKSTQHLQPWGSSEGWSQHSRDNPRLAARASVVSAA